MRRNRSILAAAADDDVERGNGAMAVSLAAASGFNGVCISSNDFFLYDKLLEDSYAVVGLNNWHKARA